VVGIEIQITTSKIRFQRHFRGQLKTPLHDQDIEDRKNNIKFHFYCEFDGSSKAVEVVKKLLQSCWPVWPIHRIVVDVSEPFRGLVVCCTFS
jgi:hypothetical protein